MMVCATKTVSTVSPKPKPRPTEKMIETRSSSRSIGNSTLNRNTTPTTNPTNASAMAAYSIQVSPSFCSLTKFSHSPRGDASSRASWREYRLKLYGSTPCRYHPLISPQADNQRLGSAESRQAHEIHKAL